MLGVIKNWLTGRDNETYSLTKLGFISSLAAMIYNFIHLNSVAFNEFGIATAALIAAMAAKYHVEKE